MLLGIDVGGTHTDVVLIGPGGIVASCKVVTNHDRLIESIITGIENVTRGVPPEEIARLNISTTLTTNALVEDYTDPVGMLVAPGPGLDPQGYTTGGHYHVLAGSVDHRGTEIEPVDEAGAEAAVRACLEDGIRVFAAVGKFSTRNPEHENRLREIIGDRGEFVTVGHKFSSQPNFPRRVQTAYFNSAVWRLYNNFADAVEGSLRRLNLKPQVNVLKADGGTMPLSLSRRIPVQSILSGPAASVMGIVALCKIIDDAVILDIGGTTTDMAVFAGTAPLIENEGISFGDRPTLVRALKTQSIGIGGDSVITMSERGVRVGPERLGPPMCRGGVAPTLIDAFNTLDMTAFGDVAASRRGIAELAANARMTPPDLAGRAIDYAVAHILESVQDLIREINEKPVYTIHELLEGRKIVPRRIYVMGGPAKAFERMLWKAFGLKVVVPEHYEVANAVGAALTRTTMEMELFADTARDRMVIPNLNVMRDLGGRYSLDEAKSDAKRYMAAYLTDMGLEDLSPWAEIVEAASFNMVDGFHTTGKNIRVKCQIKPGVMAEYSEVLRQPW